MGTSRSEAFLNLDIDLPARPAPLVIPWPSPGLPGGFLQFDDAETWRHFIGSLGIDDRIPGIVRAKFARAQTLYLMGWIDLDVLKAGELAALIALELTLMDRYGGQIPKKEQSFAKFLKHLADADGLTDAHIPMIVRTGGTAIGFVTGEAKPSLSQRRNSMAHGDPFDGLPVGGSSNWSATSSTMPTGTSSRTRHRGKARCCPVRGLIRLIGPSTTPASCR